MEKEMYAAIRKTASGEWIDTSTLSFLGDETARLASDLDAKIPYWASANKVSRIARVRITELA